MNVISVAIRLIGSISEQLKTQLGQARQEIHRTFSNIRFSLGDVNSRMAASLSGFKHHVGSHFRNLGAAFSQSLNNLHNNFRPNFSNFISKLHQGFGVVVEKFKLGLIAALGAAIGAFRGFLKSIDQVKQIELDVNNAASVLQRTRGGTFKESQETIYGWRKELATFAATKPGVTADYTAALPLVSTTVENFAGELSTEERDQMIMDATKSAGLRKASTPRAINIPRLLSYFARGATFKEINRLDAFEKNQGQAIWDEMEKVLASQGLEYRSATPAQRMKAVLEAEKKILQDPDLLMAQSDSLSGLMEGFASLITDPDIGVFGLLREFNLSDNIKSTGLNELRIFVRSFSAFAANVGKLVFGDFDPLALFFKNLKRVSDWFIEINNLMENADLDKSEIINILLDGIGNFMGTVAAWIINIGTYLISNVHVIAAGLFRVVIAFFKSLFDNLDFGQMFGALSNLGILIGVGLAKFLFSATGIALMTALAPFGAAIMAALGTALIGIGSVLTGLLGPFLLPVIAAVALIALFWDDIVAVVESIYETIVNFFSKVFAETSKLNQLWESIVRAVRSFPDALAGVFNNIGVLFGNIGNALIEFFNVLIGLINKIPGIDIPKINARNESEPTETTKQTSNTKRTEPSPVAIKHDNEIEPYSGEGARGVTSTTTNGRDTQFIATPPTSEHVEFDRRLDFHDTEEQAIRSIHQGDDNNTHIDTTELLTNHAKGNDPFGVFAAIRRERSSVGDARPVIANSSELILNRQQQRELIHSRSGGQSVSLYNTFNISGVNGQEIAHEVERVLMGIVNKLEYAYQN